MNKRYMPSVTSALKNRVSMPLTAVFNCRKQQAAIDQPYAAPVCRPHS
jgi:hypothetical protein